MISVKTGGAFGAVALREEYCKTNHCYEPAPEYVLFFVIIVVLIVAVIIWKDKS